MQARVAGVAGKGGKEPCLNIRTCSSRVALQGHMARGGVHVSLCLFRGGGWVGVGVGFGGWGERLLLGAGWVKTERSRWARAGLDMVRVEVTGIRTSSRVALQGCSRGMGGGCACVSSCVCVIDGGGGGGG